jgi:hypothetical protein
MECLGSLILFFASLPKESSAAILPTLLLVGLGIRLMRPCTFCLIALYVLMCLVLFCEESRSTGDSLFGALHLSAGEFERNVLLRMRFADGAENGRLLLTKAYVSAVLRYLVEPRVGEIYKISSDN